MPIATSDRVDSGPKYKFIYTKLLEALKVGEYEAGSKLPSENDLVKQFGASRPTVGRALASLKRRALSSAAPVPEPLSGYLTVTKASSSVC